MFRIAGTSKEGTIMGRYSYQRFEVNSANLTIEYWNVHKNSIDLKQRAVFDLYEAEQELRKVRIQLEQELIENE